MLATLLSGEVFAFLIVFVRLSAMFMLIPALGEATIPAGIRLALALVVTLLLSLVVKESLPAMPSTPAELAIMLTGEFIIGIFIGGTARLFMTALHVAGSYIAFQSGMAAAQAFDPSQGSQSALMANFFSLMGVVLIFTANLHLLLLASMAESYTLFPPGQVPAAADFAELVSQTVNASFAVGAHIAAPFIVYGIVFYTGVGILGRLMPQVQVFFIAMPLQILMAFFMLTLILSTGMMWFLNFFEERMVVFAP